MSPASPQSKCPHCLGKKKATDNLCREHRDKLKKLWYGKLKDDGFKDIEYDETRLIDYDNYRFIRKAKSMDVTAVENYYIMAGQFLYENEFNTEFDRLIWSMHADGLSIRDIVSILHSKDVRTYKRKVHEVLQKLYKKMLAEKVK